MNDDITYRPLRLGDLSPALYRGIDRYQHYTRLWRKVGGIWRVVEEEHTEYWTEADYLRVSERSARIIRAGGTVFGAFLGERLVGHACASAQLFGSKKQYAELKSLQVSCDMRGRGVGKTLFFLACAAAKGFGAEKLYISANPSEATQAFYAKCGCVESAEEYPPAVKNAPQDRQLERSLADIERQF